MRKAASDMTNAFVDKTENYIGYFNIIKNLGCKNKEWNSQ
jgi:hypothetical protein